MYADWLPAGRIDDQLMQQLAQAYSERRVLGLVLGAPVFQQQ